MAAASVAPVSAALSAALNPRPHSTHQPIPPPADPTSEEPRQILGHFAHAEAPLGELQAIGTFNSRTELLRPAAAARYRDMVAAASAEGINLAVISGFRSIETQEVLFFQRAQAQAMRPQERALVSAPPRL